jgi:hypothetical protein
MPFTLVHSEDIAMAEQEEKRAGPTANPAEQVLPDVATEPHPTPHAPQPLPGDTPQVGEGQLEEALPAITEAARKVGGFRRLSEIAGELDRAGGQ